MAFLGSCKIILYILLLKIEQLESSWQFSWDVLHIQFANNNLLDFSTRVYIIFARSCSLRNVFGLTKTIFQRNQTPREDFQVPTYMYQHFRLKACRVGIWHGYDIYTCNG
jgi:hypothetical protein